MPYLLRCLRLSTVTAGLGLRAVVGDEENQCVLGETLGIQGIEHLTDHPAHLVDVVAVFTCRTEDEEDSLLISKAKFFIRSGFLKLF